MERSKMGCSYLAWQTTKEIVLRAAEDLERGGHMMIFHGAEVIVA